MNQTCRSAFVALLLLVAMVPSPARSQPAPYEINVILPLTGGAAFVGEANAETLRIEEKTINASGGIHGRPVRFVVLDDQSNPTIDVQLTAGLIAKHVNAIIQGGLAASCRATVPLVSANGPVMYCTSPSYTPQVAGYVFVSGTATLDGMHALFNYFKWHNWKRVAIMSTTDASGQEGDAVMQQLLALPDYRDMTVTDYEHFAPADLSVQAQTIKIRGSKPDVLIAWGSGAPVQTEFRAIKEAGINIPIVVSLANQTYGTMKQWTDIIPPQLLLYSMKWPSFATIGHGPVKDAMAVMYKAYRDAGIRPDGGAAVTWDPVMILVHMLRTLPEDASAQQLRDAILQLHGYAGIDGYYDYRGNQRGVGLKDDIVVRWDSQGKTGWIPVSASAGAPLPK
jgi:branched-chain amino acid transport system substrate-binding protein